MQIDELPVGQSKKNFMVEEFPPDFDPSQQEKVDLPLKQRVKSKVWKIRIQAYEELINDQDLDCECIIQIIQDTHPQCQEKAVNIAIKFFENHPQIELQQYKELLKILLEKVLTQPKLKMLGHSLIVNLFPQCKNAIFEVIILQLQHKNPKIVQATIALIIELLQKFGLKKMDNLKPFFPQLSKLTEAQQSTIKADAFSFYKEAVLWYGKNIEAFFAGISEKNQIELKKLAEGITEIKKAEFQEEEANTATVELYDLVEAVEVFSKFPDSWCEKVFQLEKWQEKKEYLEILFKACSIPKIQQSPNIYPVIQLLKKLINEQNIAISTFSIKIAGALANGLRKNFNSYAKMLMIPIFSKLKDKKQSVVDETITTIKRMYYCCTLDEFFEEFKSLLEDKAPGTKINVFILIEIYIDENPVEKLHKMQCIKQIVPICKKFTEDGNAEVRAKSLILLAKISAKLFNGSMASDLKGDKFTKYQTLVQSYLDTNKQNIQNQPTPVAKDLIKQNKQTIQINKQIQNIQQSNQITLENLNQSESLQYSDKMTPIQVDTFLKSFKNRNTIEFGTILSQITQQSKYILQTTMEFIVDKLGDQKSLCLQLFDKMAQNYKSSYISQLIITFKNAQTQNQLIEILNLLIKYLPQCDKTLDQQLLQDFLKMYQQQSNNKARQLVSECQGILKTIFEIKKIQSEQKLPPFLINQFSDVHFEKLKEQLKIPQIPQILYEKLFSYNIQQNIAAASYIKLKIASPGEFAELFFKWAYMISWMKESIPLQTEICQLFLMLINQHKATLQEQQIVFAYIKMMILMYFKSGIQKLVQRTLPLLMNLFADCRRLQFSIQQLPNFDDYDEQCNQQSNEFIQYMNDNVLEWNLNNTMSQKQIIASMISIIQKEESIIINKPQIQISQILNQPKQNNENIQQQQLNYQDQGFTQTMNELNKLEQFNQESRILQPVNALQNQIIQNINQKPINPQMELEMELLKSFQQSYIQMCQNQKIIDPINFVDQMLQLLNIFFRERNSDQLCSFLEKLGSIMLNKEFLKQLPYQKFQQLMDELFGKMIEEVTKSNELQNKSIVRCLNSILVRVLTSQDPATMYMSLMDIIIKIRGLNIKNKIQQSVQLITRCLNKLLSLLTGPFIFQQLQQILERFNTYLQFSKQENEPEINQLDKFISQALKATLTSFLHFNDAIKIYQLVMQISDEKSLLRQWVQEYSENQKHIELANYRRSRDMHITQVIDLLKIDFEKSVDQFVSIVRRQNVNWKPLVDFLNSQQLQVIDFKLQQATQLNNLEKKVGELEKMLNQ